MDQKVFELTNGRFDLEKFKKVLDRLVENDRKKILTSIPHIMLRMATRIIPLIADWDYLKYWRKGDSDYREEYLAALLGVARPIAIIQSYSDDAMERLATISHNTAKVLTMASTIGSGNYRASIAVEAIASTVILFSDTVDAYVSTEQGKNFPASVARDLVASSIDAANIIIEAAGMVDGPFLMESMRRDLVLVMESDIFALAASPLWDWVPEWFILKVIELELIIDGIEAEKKSPAKENAQIKFGLAHLKAEAQLESLNLKAREERQRDSTHELLVIQRYSSTNQSHPENPATTDKLSRQKLVNSLAINLTHSTNKHHRAIGLLGEWGSGKSTVLKLLKDELKKTHKEQPFVFGEFNAWAYEHTDNIQAGVAQEMINALTSAPESLESKVKDKSEPEKEKTNVNFGLIWNNLCALIYKLPKFLSNYLLMDIRDVKTGVISFVVRRKLWLAVAWIVQRAWLTLQFSVKTHPFEILKILVLLLVAAMPWFTDWFDGLINDKDLAIVGQWVWSGGLVLYTLREFGKLIISPQAKELLTYLRLPSYAEHLGKIPVMRKHISTLCELRLKEKNGKTPRLLFVVDDLDRCSPEAIVKVLEAVRLVLDLENVIVLIAIDQHIALAALSKHFNDFAVHHKLKNSHAIAREYLSKVINLPIVLTAPSGDDVHVFMADLWKDMPKDSTVGTSGADREDPVDNTPRQDTGETNLPSVDSKAQPDNVPVADGSPNPGLKADVKPTVSEGDQQPSGEINPIKALSPEQQQFFIHWVNYFELTNPRQLKRLNNSYDLMRSYFTEWDKTPVAFNLPNENSTTVYPMLLTLVLMEYLNSFEDLEARGRIWKKLFSERSLVKGSASENITIVDAGVFDKQLVSTDFIKAYREVLELQDYKGLPSKVEAFVLPAMV